MKNKMKKHICIDCGSFATWCYMPGMGGSLEDDFFCDDCVSRGCSCNNQSVYYNENRPLEEFHDNCEELKKSIFKNKYIMLDYGQPIKCSGKEIETITDINKIREKIKTISNEELQNFVFKPLDSKNREFPCAEYDYSENGFDI